MSWTQIIMIVVIGVFLLGPERIPTAVQWVTGSLKKMRGMAQGAQQQLTSELGPEIAEMRRQIAELQGLKELQSLKELKDLNPRAMITKTIFGTDEAKTAGGVAGLLGLDPALLADPSAKQVSAGGPAEVTARAAQADEVSFDKGSTPGPTVSDPLPLVGGSQEQVQPASQPDPMPLVGGFQEQDQPASQPDPMPLVGGFQEQDQPASEPDPMPQVEPTAEQVPESEQPPFVQPAPAAQEALSDPIPSPAAPAALSDPIPSPAAAAEQRPAPREPVQQPLVIGGDPLPRSRIPDPLPTAGS
ncbi:hypothetical protein ABLG96_12035 [Nakamurella sp. A5-74]|uniref:Sec-independent protein translocase protein TatB n=1 Tax=Nakamurella sp. A5-74 TaxID=3158264 RepID=A0AAU8DWM1_9ACTN